VSNPYNDTPTKEQDMGRIVVSENVTLDGVVEDPTGEEGFRHGGWFARIGAEDREAWAKVELDEALAATALLFGRHSYEWFASRWISRTGPWADRLRALPKYVVSSTADVPAAADWGHTTVLAGAATAAVARLKEEVDGDLVVYGSIQLVRALVEADLVDELRLMTYPSALGAGARLFDGLADAVELRLSELRRVGDALALLTYEVERAE
jgi:dihydrofolate reductase